MFRTKKHNKSLFFLYSSDSSPRYQRNVLDILCYPERHIFRFRYQDKYVSNEIKSWARNPNEVDKKLKANGRRGIIIYAETTNDPPRNFNFYPAREIEIAGIKVEGSIYYVDIKLGKFINYFEGLDDRGIQDENIRIEKAKENLQRFRDQIKFHKFYPLPKPTDEGESFVWDKDSKEIATLPPKSSFDNKTQGYYFNFIEETQDKISPLDYLTTEHSSNSSWESVINVISLSPKMSSSIFYRISGIYKHERIWYLPSKWIEKKITSKTEGLTTIYPLPIGETATLKLLFYKSDKSWEKNSELKNQVLEIKSSSDVFAGFSQTEIPILSRYNEELIQIACKRVFDSVFAPISIQIKKQDDKKEAKVEEQSAKQILAPQPYLVTKISVPVWVKIRLLTYTVLASVLLTFSPDVFKYLGESNYLKQNHTFLSEMLINNAGWITGFFKVVGALFTFLAAYLAFRKLPVGGK